MKYRFILPGTYILVGVLFFAFFIKGAGGHGRNPFEFVYYLMFPAGFLLELLPASWGPNDTLLSSLLFVFAGLIQWTLVGYLIDTFLARRKRKKLTQKAT